MVKSPAEFSRAFSIETGEFRQAIDRLIDLVPAWISREYVKLISDIFL
jgi:hypothetical protein